MALSRPRAGFDSPEGKFFSRSAISIIVVQPLLHGNHMCRLIKVVEISSITNGELISGLLKCCSQNLIPES